MAVSLGDDFGLHTGASSRQSGERLIWQWVFFEPHDLVVIAPEDRLGRLRRVREAGRNGSHPGAERHLYGEIFFRVQQYRSLGRPDIGADCCHALIRVLIECGIEHMANLLTRVCEESVAAPRACGGRLLYSVNPTSRWPARAW